MGRSPQLVPDQRASQGNHAACLALAQRGEPRRRAAKRPLEHRRRADPVRPAADLRGARDGPGALGSRIAWRPSRSTRALSANPGAVGALVVSPTYFGAVADVGGAELPWRTAHGVPLVVDEAWGAHFASTSELPEDALAAGADLVVSSTHKIVGSLTQSAMLHLVPGSGGWSIEQAVDRAVTLVESTSPSSLLLGSLDAARSLAVVHGRDLLGETITALSEVARRSARCPDWTCWTSGSRATGCARVRPAAAGGRRAGHGSSGFEVARLLRSRTTSTSSSRPRQWSWPCSGWGRPRPSRAERLVTGLRDAIEELDVGGRSPRATSRPPPPTGGRSR